MTIKRALLSVSDKTGIVEFAKFLAAQGVTLLSTGGTAKALRDAGLDVTDVSDVTGFPEIMEGRVKTLHPKIHGGLLAKRDKPDHVEAMETHDIEGIDLVAINLYPFEETVASGADWQSCIEHIDIGGPAMIRASAKNHQHVVVVTNPVRYSSIQQEIIESGNVSEATRAQLALEAFSKTASYDAAISAWMGGSQQGDDKTQEHLHIDATLKQTLRYGENPHQSAQLYVEDSPPAGVASARQLQGKELSYNNIADTDAAFDLVSEFTDPACAIIKHANPCGVAVGSDQVDAYERAFACDPVSAYGGILAYNQVFSRAMAERLGKHFVEVIIAPSFDEEALAILSAKKNLRLLETGTMPDAAAKRQTVKSISGGYLVQERDHMVLHEADLKVVTERAPTEEEMADLKFAFTVCKHVKSNAIVYAKDRASVGIGAGQMSRVDSARIGAWKAKETATSVESAKGAVLASDAFFPFADGLESAAEHGVTAVIQPGGSIRDDEVIEAANKHYIAMVMTGIRHFRH